MSTDEVYISKISWLWHLDFLKTIDNYTRENTENVAPNSTQETSFSESDSQDFTVPRTPIRNKRKIHDPLLKGVDALEKVSTQHFSNATNDEFELFGQTIAQQLRQLPLEIALETEDMILATIRKQRVRVCNSSSSVQYVRSSRGGSEEQRLSHRASSSEPETISSNSDATANNLENEYSTYTFDNDDVLSQAIASIQDLE